MNAEGLFFLRRGPYSAITSNGEHSVLLLLCERAGGPLPQIRHITAHWAGADAGHFVDQHAERLHSGCALHLRLTNLRSLNSEIHADVLACALAPDRWPKSERKGPDALVHGSCSATKTIANAHIPHLERTA